MSDSGLVLQRMYYIGVISHALLYGIEIYMYFQSLYLFTCQPPAARKTMFPYVFVGGIMVFLYAWTFAGDAYYGQLMWVEHSDFPGGPAAFFEEDVNVWFQVSGSLLSMIADWLGEALLMYRCWIIWGGEWKVIVLPGLLLLGSIATGIITTVESAFPTKVFFVGRVINFGLPWSALTVATNATLTIFICIRMIQARRQVQSSLDKCDLKVYTSIMAMVIESTLPFTLLGILFTIAYSKGWNLTFYLLNVWSVFIVISPQMIILRVMMGRAWDRDVASRAYAKSSISFHYDSTEVTQGISIESGQRTGSTIAVSEQSEHSVSTDIIAKRGDLSV